MKLLHWVTAVVSLFRRQQSVRKFCNEVLQLEFRIRYSLDWKIKKLLDAPISDIEFVQPRQDIIRLGLRPHRILLVSSE